MNFIYRDNLKLEKENIYYFILDGMQPIEGFENFYDVELKEFLSFVEKNKYKHIKNSENYYGNTKHDISALFYLDKIFLNREKAIFKENTNIIFPTLMRHTEKSNLMVNLKNLGYNFKWLGNFFAYCPKYNLRFCLDKKKIFYRFYLYINFLDKLQLFKSLGKLLLFFNYDFNKNFFYKLNDGIGRLHSHLEKNDNLVVKISQLFILLIICLHIVIFNNSNCAYKFSPEEQMSRDIKMLTYVI